MPRKIACGIGLLLIASAALSTEPERLPAGVTPIHYDLALVPDASHLTFRGQVRIEIDVKTSTPDLVLNADDLVIDKAVLDTKESAVIALGAKLQRATLTFAHAVVTGRHTLAIDYHGKIGLSTLGFFAMDYDSASGKRRTIATNFEPASERRFMPSWDEPAFKATFSISTDVPAGLMAVSNMPIASTESLANGVSRVHFATTPKMSTYLLFLAIGDFERIATKVDSTDLGVVVNRGDAEKGRYALQEASRLLHYYNEYFGFHYALPKLDLVVAPGDIDGGSMENWGAIFYGQQDLLFDPHSSTVADRQNVFRVVAHEMAHQWFGDLVTMAWWDDIWLNEGFATWMTPHPIASWKPDWMEGQETVSQIDRSMAGDSVINTRPIHQEAETRAEIEQLFDGIAYGKTASVLHMLESYLGPETFRSGVNLYLKEHAYGNATAADFWGAMARASKKPIDEIMPTFVLQKGVPFVGVEAKCEGGNTTLKLSQQRYFDTPAGFNQPDQQIWQIPVCAKGINGTSAGNQQCFLLTQREQQFTLKGCSKFVFPDSSAMGYYRFDYDSAALHQLGNAVMPSGPLRPPPPATSSTPACSWAPCRPGTAPNPATRPNGCGGPCALPNSPGSTPGRCWPPRSPNGTWPEPATSPASSIPASATGSAPWFRSRPAPGPPSSPPASPTPNVGRTPRRSPR